MNPYNQKQISERNKDLIAMAVAGLTLREIGENFKLTRERVRQLINKYGSDELISYRKDKKTIICPRCQVKKIPKSSGYCKECRQIIKSQNKSFWSRKHKIYGCLKCGCFTKRHGGKGLCERCYSNYGYHNLPGRKERRLAHSRRWVKNNPEKVKIMQKKASVKFYEKNGKRLYEEMKNDPVRWARHLERSREYYRKKKLNKQLKNVE